MAHYVETRSKRLRRWYRPLNVPTPTSNVQNRFNTFEEAKAIADAIAAKFEEVETRVCSITHTYTTGA